MTLADVPWKRNRVIVSTRSRGQLPRVDELEERPPRVERADHRRGVVLGPVRERDADGPAALRDDLGDRRLEDDLGPERSRRPREHLREAAVAALVERPRSELAVVLADRVVEQHETRPCERGPTLVPMMLDDAR